MAKSNSYGGSASQQPGGQPGQPTQYAVSGSPQQAAIAPMCSQHHSIAGAVVLVTQVFLH